MRNFRVIRALDLLESQEEWLLRNRDAINADRALRARRI
jgi:hypothetical protein